MLDGVNLYLILATAFAVTASPGASTLAIAGASMHGGRRQGFSVAAGITLGSWFWSAAAAFGLGTIMLTNPWIFDLMRYLGAAYLLFLGWRAARAAWLHRGAAIPSDAHRMSFGQDLVRGLLIHLTNPKVILFFASLYAAGMPAGRTPADLALIVALVGLQSMFIFIVYVMVFSIPSVARSYARLSRIFDTVIALMFAALAFSLLAAKLPT